MALVKCKECGAQISTEAKACPGCGAKPPKKTTFRTWLALIFIVLLVYGLNHQESAMTPEQRTARAEKAAVEQVANAKKKADADRKNQERTLIGMAKASVRERLKDPDSAQFKDVQLCCPNKALNKVCGWVNSKNAFGGYVGFQAFISTGQPEGTVFQNDVKDFESLLRVSCDQ